MDKNVSKQLLDKIEEKTNVKADDLLNIANGLEYEKLAKTEEVRKIVKDIAAIANVSVSKDKENQIVDAVTSQFEPLND